MLRHQGQFEGIQVEDHCDAKNCLVSMDRDRLMQVWINLLLNARDAMQGKGCITLSAESDGQDVRIEISDEGDGIDPEALKKVFEPFFTTKAPGQGYGLGLAVCQRIVDESGGSIQVNSEKGQGTRFEVVLPCVVETSA